MKVAIVYQANPVASKNNIIKPMKVGGYADSGADIAFSLKLSGIEVVTPVDNPKDTNDLDWVFPDTEEGIDKAIAKGAKIIWLNTVLYKGHPIEKYKDKGLKIVGQSTEAVDLFDNKVYTNNLLRSKGLPVLESKMISLDNHKELSKIATYPNVLKPIRGRGSEGVRVVENQKQFVETAEELINSGRFGDTIYTEDFLPGEEITITVLPPGTYVVQGEIRIQKTYWCFPALRRFNHINNVMPYNGVVAVTENSEVLQASLQSSQEVVDILKQCEKAASIINGHAPIRIDCRANKEGKYFIFDVNLKPNMTGASRSHRKEQDSLSSIAARLVPWGYRDLIVNVLGTRWEYV
ncbi:ATP-grasp domain-containing protein [Myroides sp. LoEW2-1]|uniref:ATP-grasp domain-containing protein n=1 Tax=Myroides sp. LoEW2-1 TaxID=2683192 RepID=UPI00132BC419|nr:ATP-grasp domain-containing protein [Myroides sp. LoEW2-1]MVX36374.1 ATP-grasp domain-containing protein [Myroides sp. LoEW2-1]